MVMFSDYILQKITCNVQLQNNFSCQWIWPEKEKG